MRTFVDTVNRFAWSVTNGSSDLRVDGLIICCCCCFFLVNVFLSRFLRSVSVET